MIGKGLFTVEVHTLPQYMYTVAIQERMSNNRVTELL